MQFDRMLPLCGRRYHAVAAPWPSTFAALPCGCLHICKRWQKLALDDYHYSIQQHQLLEQQLCQAKVNKATRVISTLHSSISQQIP